MNDQYRINATASPPKAATSHYKLISAALWIGLIGGTAFNFGLQLIGLGLLAVPFGVMAVFCGIALIVRAIAGKRR